MKRILHPKSEILVGHAELVFELSPSDVTLWVLELTLLLGGYVDTLQVNFERATLLLQLDGEKILSKAKILSTRPDFFRVRLGRNQAEYLHAVLLRAYRDGYGEVDHIHIFGDQAGESFDLTVCFERYAPPVAPEVAMQMLDK